MQPGARYYGVGISPIDGAVYACGNEKANSIVRRSTTGQPNTFETVFYSSGTAGSGWNGISYGVAVSPFEGAVYVATKDSEEASPKAYVRRSQYGLSGTYLVVDYPGGLNQTTYRLAISPVDGTVYAVGAETAGAVVRRTSSSFNNITGSVITLTGATGAILKRGLYDGNNVLLVNGRNLAERPIYNMQEILGYNKNNIHPILFPKLKMDISSSAGTFNPADITIRFKEDASGSQFYWTDYTNIATRGVVSYLTTSTNGWVQYEYDFFENGVFKIPSMSYVTGEYSIILSSSAGKTHTFQNIALYFKESLTNKGAKFYRDIDNSNNEQIFNNIAFLGTKVS